MRRRIRRRTLGKDSVKMSSTLVANIGQGTASPTKHEIVDTSIGVRTGSGSTGTSGDPTTSSTANIGNIIKYLNICIETGSRWITGDVATKDDNGWLEYAIVMQQEREQDMASTNLGVQTLQDTAQKQYRSNVIFTGCVPIGASQPTSADIKIKVPPKFCKLQQGSNWNIYYHFRSVNSADVRTDSLRLVSSAIFKRYQ